MDAALAAHRVALTKRNRLNHPSDENAAVNPSAKRGMSKEVRKAASPPPLRSAPPALLPLLGWSAKTARDPEMGPDGEAQPGQAVGPLCLEISPKG